METEAITWFRWLWTTPATEVPAAVLVLLALIAAGMLFGVLVLFRQPFGRLLDRTELLWAFGLKILARPRVSDSESLRSAEPKTVGSADHPPSSPEHGTAPAARPNVD